MSGPVVWSTLAVMGPLAAALVALGGRRWNLRLGLGLGSASALAAATGLALTLRERGPVRHLLGGWGRPLGIELYADGLAVGFLGLAAVVGAAVSWYASAYFGDVADPRTRHSPAGRGARFFAPLWLFLWAAWNALLLSGDVFNLYVTLEILGLSAAALVTLAVTRQATVAGMRYLFVSLVGSMLFLLGVALLYLAHGTLSLHDLGAMQPSGPAAFWALAAMTVGLAAKTALFPLHAWLPPAHAGAPAPGSAVLSALVVKASFYVILRLWVHVYGIPSEASGQEALTLVGLAGAAAIFWGSLLALRQVSLKRLVAYSTIAQVGYLFVMFPLLPLAGEPGASGAEAGAVSGSLEAVAGWSPDAWNGGLLQAISHGLAKAAMFLAAGSMSYAVADDAIDAVSGVAHKLPMSFLAFGLAGLSLAGIPPSGGFVAKWLLLLAAIDSGRWFWAVPVAVGGLLTVAYVLMVGRYALEVRGPPTHFRPVPRRMEWAALVLALLAVALGLRATEAIELLGVGGLSPWR